MVWALFGMLMPNQVSGQTYTYDQTKSALNVGNPGSYRGSSVYDYITTGGTLFMRGWTGPNGTTSSSYQSTNYWSPAQKIPFTFKFYGGVVDSFCVSKNGLLTFDMSVAGSAVSTSLNTNSSLPNSNLPDSTVAYFWENMGTTIGNYDYIYKITYGSSGSRQLWILNYSWELGASSYCYFAVVLEEGTNNIYVVDMNYFYSTTAFTTTVGTQLSSSSAVQVTTGLNSSAGSPNIIFGTGNSLSTNNEYYKFESKLLVTDNVALTDIVNPGAAICSTKDTVKVLVKNDGTNSVTAFDVYWSVNGVSKTKYAYSGTLTAGSSTTLALGVHTYSGSSSQTIIAYTKDPNGNTDKDQSNDTFTKSAKKGLSGTYTVGGTSPNYATLKAAIAAVDTYGVCGPIVFNIATGTYSGQFDIPDFVGTSSTNTVTFQAASGDRTDVILKYGSTSSSAKHTLRVNNSRYIVIRDLTIQGTGTSYAWPLHLMNSNDITVRNCIIKTPTTTSTSSNMITCVINNSTTSYSSGAVMKNITIDSCHIMNGGYTTVSFFGASSTSLTSGFVYSNNTITAGGYYAHFFYYQGGATIHNNTVTNRANTYAGFYFYYSKSSSTASFKITSNKLVGSTYYGIYMSQCDNLSSQRGLFANNSIGGFTGAPTYYGLFNSGGDYWDVYHNSININVNSSGTARACYFSGAYNFDIKNNVFAITSSVSSGNHYAYYNTVAPSTTNKVDYNVYYNPNGTYLMYSGGYRTAAVLNTYNSNGDQNSVIMKPPFVSNADLHLSDGCFQTFPAITAVPKDIDGETRNTSDAHAGCDEVGLSNDDVGVVEVLSPLGTVSAGTQTVKVVVKNFGLNSVNGYTVKYKVGSNTGTENIGSAIASCASDTVTFGTTFTHTAGCTSIIGWTEDPGGNTDLNPSNDTSAAFQFGTAMSGTFTIGGTSGDYSTFAEALNALNCAGLSGPVVFNVMSGTYTENLSLTSLTGMSSTNTVTFQSATSNSTMPLLQYDASGTTDNYTLNFSGASNYIFDGLHIKALDGTYARVITFDGTNSNITIQDCKIESQKITVYNFNGIAIYDATGTSNMSSNITFKDNEIINGFYSFYIYGGHTSALQNNWSITGNTITGFTYYGIFCYYNNNMVISNNEISSSNSSYTVNQYALYLRYCDGATQIVGNNIHGLSGGYGLYMYYCDATSGAKALISNNMIQMGSGSNAARGIYCGYSKYLRFYHNTCVVNSSYYSTSGVPGYFFFTSTSSYPGNEVKNNIFANTGGGYAVYLYYSGTNHYFAALDYNVYYSTASGNIMYAGGYYSNVAAYQTAKSKDLNSFGDKPPFKSSSDLHLADACYSKVPKLSEVPTDIDGSTRPSTTHPGADDVQTGALDVGVLEILSPSGVVTSGGQTIKVVVKNFGSTALTSVKVNYLVGTTSGSQTFSVSTASCTSDTLTFTTGFTHTAGCATIRAWTSDPNGSTDAVPSNDEGPSSTFGIAMAGGIYTIGGTSGDFSTFGEAVAAMECAGIGGAMTFNVISGTYTENISLNNILGVSSTNTITFQSASTNTTMPILQYSALGGNYVVRFNGISYVTFSGIHMKALDPTNCRVIDFSGANKYITITGCTLESQVITSYNFNGIVIYDWTGTANMSSFITITNNKILNGFYGIYNYGAGTSSTYMQDGWVITGNTISGFAYYGILNYYNKNLIFSNNEVTTSNAGYTSYPYMTYFRYCDGAMEITGNRIYGGNGGYGMYMYYCDATSTGRATIANNFIQAGNGTTIWARPVYSQYCSYQDWLHNTILNTSLNTSNSFPACRLYYTSNTSNVKNNIFAHTGGGYAIYFYNPAYLQSDYNNIYSTSTGSYIYSGGIYSSLAAYQTAKSRDLNSQDMKPFFVSSSSYKVNQESFFGAGDSTGTMLDILGMTRPSTKPTIGALELNPDLNMMSVTIVDTVCGTSNPTAKVKVTFKNEGDFDIQKTTVGISVDGGTPVMESITGPFTQGATYTVALTTTVDLSGTTNNVVMVTNYGGDVDNADNSASTTVPYWAKPVSSFTYKDSCLGDAMQFKNTSTVATGTIASTAWAFGDGNTATTTDASNIYASSGTYNVTITSTSNEGCVGASTQQVKVLTELLPGSISANATICYSSTPASLSSVSLASGSTGTNQYQWQSSLDNSTWSDISGATATDYSPGVLTTTTYYRRAVTTDIGCGPSYTTSIKITVYDDLAAGVISVNQTICYNTTPTTISQITTPTGGDGSWTYQWEVSTNGTSWSNVSGATATSYSPSNLTVTMHYRLMATGGSGCGDIVSNTVVITVYLDLNAGLIGSGHSVCPSNPANPLSTTSAATGGDGTYTYQWQSSTDNVNWTNVSGATSANYSSTTPLTVTTYYRRNTTSGNGCGTKATNSVAVTIAPLPVSSFILANHCFNDVMPVTNNSSVTTGSITGWAWDFGDGNTSTAKVPSHVYATSGVKTVNLIVTTNIGCVDTATETVNVSNVPTPSFSTVYDCDNEKMLFKNATSVNCGKISAFYWEFGDGTTSTTQNPSHAYASSGTYTIKFKIFLPGGFIDSVSRNIVIADETVAGFTADDECFGDSVRFINSSTNANIYAWDFDDKNTSSLENPVHFYRVTGTYKVSLITTDGNGCDDTTVNSVTVKVRPSVYFTTDNRCVSTKVPYINGTLYAHTYAWSFGDGNSSNSSAGSLTHTFATANTYTTKLVAYNNNGCRDSFSTNVVVYPNPSASFTISDLCTDDAVSVTNTSSSNHSNHWDMGDGTTFTTTTPSSTYKYSTSGTYTVMLAIASVYGCPDTATSSVVVYDSPDPDFTANNVCLGNATSFTNGTTGGTGTVTHSWNFGDGNTSTSTSPTHTYATAGKYTVTLTSTGQGSCMATTTKVVEVYVAPTVVVTVSDVCLGQTSSFVGTTTGASTYLWNFGDGNTSTAQSPSHTYTSSGTYTVSFTATSAQWCVATTTTTTRVNELPKAGFTATIECLGTATMFTNTSSVSSGTLTYAWTFGDGNSSTAANPSHVYASAGNFSVVLISTANGCATTYSVSVKVNDMPTASFTTSNGCLGSTTTFNNYSGGASSYAWDFGDGNTSTASAPAHTYSSSGTYTVKLTATNAAGCESIITQSVVIYPTPTVGFTTANVCVGEDATFTNSSSTGSYLWSFGDGVVSTSTNPTHAYKKSGTFTVTLDVMNSNGCSDLTTRTIVVYDAPTAGFADVNGCQNSSIQFANTSSGASGYSWTFGDAGTSGAENPGHTYTANGTYTVTLTASNSNGCSDMYSRSVIVSAQPMVNFTNSNACEGSQVSFTNTSTQGANAWDFGDGTTGRLTNPSHSYASAGIYNVKLTITTAAGCVNSTNKSVTVSPNPIAAFTSQSLCTGPNASFTNNSSVSSGVIASSSWNYGDGNVGTSSSHNYAKAGVYNVTLTVTSDQGCMASTTSIVIVYDAPVAIFSSTDACLGDAVSFTNSSQHTTMSTWLFGDGGTSSLNSPSHAYSSANTYTVTLTAMNPIGCTDITTRSVKINTNPTADFSAPDGCVNAETLFTNTSTGGTINSWNFGDGNMSGAVNPTHRFTSSGLRVVTLIVSSSSGCSDEISKVVSVHTSPVAAFTAIGNCLGQEISFMNTSQNGNSFAWSFGDGNMSTDDNPTHTYTTVGDYRSLLVVANANCLDSSEVLVQVNALPNSGFNYTTSGREVSFSPIELGGSTYDWNFDDGGNSTDVSPIHRFVGAIVDTFNVCLNLVDQNGCMSESCVDVNVNLVGVESINITDQMNIYPNPNQGRFTIVLGSIHGDVNIEVFDARGVLVSKIDASNLSVKYSVDVTGIAEGVYFVTLKNGTYTTTQRVVITR